jgi:AcrR family transcriptional regulator
MRRVAFRRGDGILQSMARGVLTRSAVVDRARDMVRAEGVANVSLRSVARDLGVTAPALYAYVDDYDDLLDAVARSEFERLYERFAAVDGDDPGDAVRALARAYIAHARDEPHLHRLMFRDAPPGGALVAGTPPCGPSALTFTTALAVVERAMAAGCIQGDDPVLGALTVWSVAHGVAEVLLMGFDLSDDLAEALVDEALDATLGGLARART